ncbi:hypothetical protein EDB92DRAFT_1949279 [Lactarius akahatsu]|uniref:Rho-GAP domain-containing protein n=1 Tax=Lactarius akahatsu TaxID=416441 RepID=A0AAD4QB75_9AGAM|nr:hypothetical protein EDB92DRAFT_1949279 [Lactarius akahatsu]
MSFISVEPQSRVFLESHSNSLLTQFDIQLEIIADRYLAFFQERRRIEVSYISSLRKLHREATAVDAPFDPRAEPTTTRTAWDKVRDSLEGEANTQQAFVDILDSDVIKPLETEDRTRKRVEEGLEESAAKYANHAENTILKLQQAYLKKHNPRQYPQSTDFSQGSQDGLNKKFGNKVSALFGGRQEDLGGLEPSKSEEVSDDDCRRAVALLNTFRLKRVENLGDGYDCLGKLVFTPTIMGVLVNYMDGLTEACTKRGNLATNTGAEVENALTGTDTSGLRMSLGHALAFSIPPLTLYCNYRPDAYSDLIFGVPLVDLTTDVPKVIRMCIDEIEKRGLDTHKIYSVGSIYDADILQLRRRFESEQSFSFDSTDNIHSVAMLLKRYLWDLPEPLFMLSLEDCRQYRQNRARYTENGCSVLRSRIRELHSVHKASLEAVLQHLLLVAFHSDKNAMNVKALAAQFCYTVFRGNAVLEGGKLVMEDLIQNAYSLFDESPPQSSFSTSQSDSPVEGRLTSLPELSLSQTLKEEAKTITQEQVIPGAQAVETLLNGSPPEAVSSLPPALAAEWWLPHPGLHQHPEAPTIPPSRPESVLSSASDFSLCAASSISGAEFPPSPAASSLSVTTGSLPSPAASLLSSMGTSSPTISERI